MAVAFGTEAIFENDASDAVIGEPFGVACAFVWGEAAVAAAWADDDGGAGGFLWGGEEGGEGGFVVVILAESAWGAVWPEGDGGERGGVENGEEERGEEEG